MDGSSVASEIPDLLENLIKFPPSSSSEASYSARGDPFQRRYRLYNKHASNINPLALKETTEASSNKEQSPSTELTYQAYNISNPKRSLQAYLSRSPRPPQKKLKKKAQPAKKIHSTISNQDNSLYLVVSRQESDKVYEIKTSVTGSATLLKIKPDTYSFKSSENVSVKNSFTSNKILESVKMERKRQEENEAKKADSMKAGERTTGVQFGRETTVCHCPFITKAPKKKNNFKPTADKSRVRITGRLGLTEDDKYVLKCAATIDGQPIETRYAETKGKDSPVNIFFNQHPSQSADVDTEARMELANKNEATYNICRKGSAATQVNLNLFFPGENTEQKDETVQCCCGYTKEISTFTEDDAVTEAEQKNPLVVISVFKKRGGQDRSDFDIKVGEAGDVTIVDNNLRTSETLHRITPAANTSFNGTDAVSRKNTGTISDKNVKGKFAATARAVSPLRSPALRSPTSPRNESTAPFRSTATANNERKDPVRGTSSPLPRNPKLRPEASTDRTRSLSKGTQSPPRTRFEPNLERRKLNPRTDTSPERNQLSKTINSSSKQSNKTDSGPERSKLVNRTNMSPERNKLNKMQVTPMKTKEFDKKSPYVPFSIRQSLRATAAERNKSKLTFEVDNNVSPRKLAIKQDNADQIKGANTVAAKAKKSLVDAFTRNITEKMATEETENLEKIEGRTHSTSRGESTGSRVTVNIDAENEFYDLMFQHDSDTTDLNIRKRSKFRGSPKHSMEHYHENLTASLENILVSPENNDRKRSVSQTWNNYDNVAYMPSADNPITTPLKFIDSIEVSHRREERINSVKLTQNYFEKIPEDAEDKFTAPTKHYPGDKCQIVDPMQREMEIRELLGVQKRKLCPITPAKIKIDSIDTISKHSHKDTFPNIYRPHQKRKINVLVLLNKKPDIGTMVVRSKRLNRGTDCVELKSMSTQCECVIKVENEIQMEAFHVTEKDMPHKSKSISLCKEDYNKVRKLIQRTLAPQNKYRIKKRVRVVLLRKIRMKRDKVAIFVDISSQTVEVKVDSNKTNNKDQTKAFLRSHAEGDTKENDNAINTTGKRDLIDIVKHESKKTIVLFMAKIANRPKKSDSLRDSGFPVQTLSAVELRYANVSYKLAENLTSKEKYNNRILSYQDDAFVPDTGRRPISPNLGFSGLSLCGEPGSMTSLKKSPTARPRKPLLRRLVSCLVLKSQRMAKMKKERSTPKMSSSKSSVDWYQVTSSCAPFEMSSSIYDTSASLYSDHAVKPITIKSRRRRRGFLSSVWSMLTS